MANDSPRFQLNPRQEAVLERLERDGRVEVSELAVALEVSTVTIRKDLQQLERLSLLHRVHGGAVGARRSKYNLSLGDRVGRRAIDKLAIARAALALIHDGDTVILDAGSTTLALARLLPGRVQGVTVVTNSLPVIAELSGAHEFDLVALGGMVRQHSLATIGPLTVASLGRLHADTAFLGATGVSLDQGLCTPNIIEAETKAAMVSASSRRVAVVDHGKLGHTSLAPFAPWEVVDQVVTDRPLPEPFRERFEQVGVETIVSGGESG